MPYVELSYRDVTGLRLYYERADAQTRHQAGVPGEAGGGPPVVLVHGAAQDTLSWRFVLPGFAAAGYDVWALDLPGHGKSALPASGPVDDLAVYADVVAAFCDTLRLADPVVVGHSMSGGVVLHLLADTPDRLHAGVVVDGAGFTNRTYNDDFFSHVRINPGDWFEVNFREICSPRTPAGRVEEVAFDVRRCPPAVAWNDILAYARLDLRGRLDRIGRPVVFVHGADDWSITPKMAEQTAAACTQAETVVRVLDGVGHFPHVEAGERFTAETLVALSQLPAQ